eukprot:1595705-Rhodomonas_salina.1
MGLGPHSHGPFTEKCTGLSYSNHAQFSSTAAPAPDTLPAAPAADPAAPALLLGLSNNGATAGAKKELSLLC